MIPFSSSVVLSEMATRIYSWTYYNYLATCIINYVQLYIYIYINKFYNIQKLNRVLRFIIYLMKTTAYELYIFLFQL